MGKLESVFHVMPGWTDSVLAKHSDHQMHDLTGLEDNRCTIAITPIISTCDAFTNKITNCRTFGIRCIQAASVYTYVSSYARYASASDLRSVCISHARAVAHSAHSPQFFKREKLYTARVIRLDAFAVAAAVVIKFQPSSA